MGAPPFFVRVTTGNHGWIALWTAVRGAGGAAKHRLLQAVI